MNINKLLLILLLSFIGVSTYAQTAKKSLNYQAVILDPKAIDVPGASIVGQPLNKGNVCLRFSLLNALGGLDYEETQQVTTDEYGLVNVAIGTGTQGSSNSIYKSFESIVWNASVKSLKVSVSYDGCNSFKQVSTQALNYTPYSLYAEAVEYKNVREAPTKLSQFSNDAGYLIPKDLDPIKTDIKNNANQITTSNQIIADNKKSSDDAFLIVNQSIKSLDTKVADNATATKDNTSSISVINSKLIDQQSQIVENRNQISSTNTNLNNQIGGLQGQIRETNATVNNLSGAAEVVSNKSTSSNLGGANPSDQLYPSQKAAKAYVDNAIYDAVGTGVADATTLAPGKIQLSGDLAGTATSPTVPALAGKENSSNKSISVQTDAASDTKYPSVKAVKAYVDQATAGIALQAAVDGKADKASPTFTGTPVLPTGTTGVTQSAADNSTKLATTAFVQQATAGIAFQAAVDLKAPLASPTFTGTPSLPTGTTAVTQSANDNSTKLATTAFVTSSVSAGAPDATTTSTGKIQLAGDLGGTAAAPTVPGLALKANATDVTTSLALKEDASNKSNAALGTSTTLFPTQSAVKTYVDTQIASATISDADAVTKGKIQLAGDLAGTASSPTVPGLALKAPLASPTFTGTVGGITQSMVGLGNVNNTSDANKPVSTATQTALDLKAPLASPTFTGTPTLPTGSIAVTQNLGDRTTSIATTAFVDRAISTSNATNANLTGPITSIGNATSIASQTGTGSTFVMDTSPTLVTPVLGAATGTSLSVSGQLTSTVATGTAPLVVTSTTPVANLSIGGNAATATTATNATNTAITDDAATATAVYPTFVTGNTGNLPQKVTSTKLSFVPSTGVLSATSFAGSGAALTGVVATTNANLTGPITSVGNATSIASQTGTGNKFVMDTSPTLVTPTIGVATATSVNKVTITAPATSSTLTIADGKTLAANNSLTLSGTDGKTMTFPTTDATIARTDAAQTFTGTQTFVGTVTGTPTSSAALDVTSTTQGFLPPRLTTTQRNAIATPAEGLTVWNTTNKQLEVYDGVDWVNMLGNKGPNLKVGDSYGGGIIAHIFTKGETGYVAKEIHGLIAATSDQSTGIQWRNGTNSTTGATGQAIGTGLANTNTIITIQGATATSYAAGLARAHNGGGYTDWFLPSRFELATLYLNRVAIGGFSTNSYHSSSETSSSQNYMQDFNNGFPAIGVKSFAASVRAVRTF